AAGASVVLGEIGRRAAGAGVVPGEIGRRAAGTGVVPGEIGERAAGAGVMRYAGEIEWGLRWLTLLYPKPASSFEASYVRAFGCPGYQGRPAQRRHRGPCRPR